MNSHRIPRVINNTPLSTIEIDRISGVVSPIVVAVIIYINSLTPILAGVKLTNILRLPRILNSSISGKPIEIERDLISSHAIQKDRIIWIIITKVRCISRRLFRAMRFQPIVISRIISIPLPTNPRAFLGSPGILIKHSAILVTKRAPKKSKSPVYADPPLFRTSSKLLIPKIALHIKINK